MFVHHHKQFFMLPETYSIGIYSSLLVFGFLLFTVAFVAEGNAFI